MIKWIIFYVGMNWGTEAITGNILFFEQDSVKAFNITWKIVSYTDVRTRYAAVMKGIINLESDGIKARMTITGSDILLLIDDQLIPIKQRNHTDKLYKPIEKKYKIKEKWLYDRW